MSSISFRSSRRGFIAAAGAAFVSMAARSRGDNAAASLRWIATWAAAPQACEPNNMPGVPLAEKTLVQYVRISRGGERFRLRLSNEFSREPLVIRSASLRPAASVGELTADAPVRVSFGGQPHFTVPAGVAVVSDPIALSAADRALLAISLCFESTPEVLTAHPGSRTTSYIADGDQTLGQTVATVKAVDHWYVISGLSVETHQRVPVVAVIGDSITDGRGSTTNANNRWPDQLLERFYAKTPGGRPALVNLGIGGNRLLRDGLGPSALARFDRDVLAQPGVTSVIVLEGINDLGTAAAARREGKPHASAEDLIFALGQLATRARLNGLKVFGGTILPFEGAQYFTEEGEAARQKVNAWVRSSGAYDGVVDFDAAMRDPAKPTRLRAELHTGDWLHPNVEGYAAMAATVPLEFLSAMAAP
jgi:lysophospholipase L1-like esterase